MPKGPKKLGRCSAGRVSYSSFLPLLPLLTPLCRCERSRGAGTGLGAGAGQPRPPAARLCPGGARRVCQAAGQDLPASLPPRLAPGLDVLLLGACAQHGLPPPLPRWAAAHRSAQPRPRFCVVLSCPVPPPRPLPCISQPSLAGFQSLQFSPPRALPAVLAAWRPPQQRREERLVATPGAVGSFSTAAPLPRGCCRPLRRLEVEGRPRGALAALHPHPLPRVLGAAASRGHAANGRWVEMWQGRPSSLLLPAARSSRRALSTVAWSRAEGARSSSCFSSFSLPAPERARGPPTWGWSHRHPMARPAAVPSLVPCTARGSQSCPLLSRLPPTRY